MKAMLHTRYGPPDVLRFGEIERPVPGDNDVLLRVHAATVNRTDCAMLTAKPAVMRLMTGLTKPKKNVLGTDVAGTVEAIGRSVTSFKPGDRVFGFDDNGLCSHAQYLTMSEERTLTTIPDGISFEEAAASIEGAHYAFNFIKKVNVKKGDRILVNGATGAIGSAMLQMLKYFGATVTAVGNTKNLSLLKTLGADSVIDYTVSDFTTSDKKYRFVFDAVGKSTYGRCKHLLEPGGVYISSELGPNAQNVFLALSWKLTSRLPGSEQRTKVIFPIPTDIKGSLLFVKSLITQGKFRSVIDRTYPLEKTADAFRYVAEGNKTGNVVITVDG